MAALLAERMVRTDRDVDDELFAELRARFGEAELVELAAWIGLQSLYSSFNRLFRVAAG